MNKILRLFLISASVMTLLSGIPTAIAEAPAITSTPTIYDFGDIYPEDGLAETTVQITNSGNATLEIYKLATSCGCTTAEMDMSDLKPQETREMKIVFDPSVHPEQVGELKRAVYLKTSDPLLPELTIDLTGNIIRSETPEGPKKAVIFFNEACQDCGELVKEEYPEILSKYGYELETHDYINEKSNRDLLNEFNDKWQVPFELQSHLETFLGDKLLIGGHVPEEIIYYLLDHPEEYDKLLVFQDKMHGEGVEYQVWDFKGGIKTYELDEPITTYLKDIPNNESSENPNIRSSHSFFGLFAIITPSAFLDGINPCAIAVLLFFVAFLFSIKRSKRNIWKIGLIYVFAIYLAYLLIGLGIAQAIIISGYPHLMAYIGAYLVITLGVIQLISTFYVKFPIKLRIPINTKATLEKWLYKGTVPAAFIGGFVVGLCTFPCSGGIYVAIIGMLQSAQTQTQGFFWMLWYNLIFVLPLIIILFMAGNPKTTEKLQELERKGSKVTKVITGLTMIAVGLIIILFFTN